MKEFVTRELYKGQWVNTYFYSMREAKALCRKILSRGGVAICLRSAR